MTDQTHAPPEVTTPRDRRRAIWRRVLWGGGGFAAVCVVAGIAGVTYLTHGNLGPFVARRASAMLRREVQVAAMHVTPGAWLKIEVENARLANIAGGSEPDMVRVGHLSFEVRAISLLHGPAILRHLALSDVRVLVERTPQKLPNWRFGAAALTPPKPAATPQTVSPQTASPDDRRHYPTLLDARIVNGEVIYRTAHGASFRTTLKTVTIDTRNADTPVSFAVDGAYNDVPVRMTATLQPFSALRRIRDPYGIDLQATSGDMVMTFRGTAVDPLNADGIVGAVSVKTETSKSLMAIAGMAGPQDVALRMAGQFAHDGSLWTITGGEGAVKDNPMTVSLLRFVEGMRGQPDHVTADIAFSRLDLNEFLGDRKASDTANKDMVLDIDRAPDPLIDAKVSVGSLSYNVLHFSNMALAASVMPGVVSVERLALDYLGARLNASGRMQAVDGGGAHVSAVVDVNGLDIQKLRQTLGFASVPLQGRLDLRMTADATQRTLNAAVHEADVAAAVSMTGGRIDRTVIGAASTDLRMIFRRPKGMTPVACLLGVVNAHAGVGSALPLRVRTAEGTISGNARFDLNRKWFNLIFGSQASTTSSFALDIPVQVSGGFSSPRILPARWTADGRSMLAETSRLNALPVGVRQFAMRNPCYRPGGR
ncbi:AsmA family protein [Brytella acorum]|uniref:AsmA-like C-terminal domain-containing protein n=1 Tax=Brytella acorum TaxID=2959299 RepID=A0AA35UPF6_9PROT|nr:AsmA-like C-terminal region-containing protein [Brytella acorum]MDF3625797.1 AsmA-like C-terminal region-containing protein [Brytella acorum]CAI9121226.1 hypothetical protein LMG32879_002073 [Brytella acorum]